MAASHRVPPAETFQDLILRLMTFWSEQGCLLTQAFDAEKGAGTYNPSTFLRAVGPEPWRAAYVEPSRRPTDGRYGENPNRLYRHHQFQVILKPSPPDLQGLYLDSLRAIGIHPDEHDIRFVEDNWESPTLGAWGLGWEVWVDGMEATQFTYFQQCGGLECKPVTGELTYGLERLAMYLQNVDNVYDLAYAPGVSYGQVFHQDEVEYSRFSFEHLDVSMYSELYERMEKETERLVGLDLPVAAYDHLLHAAHAFNALDARGAISVTERQGYILRIRDLARMTAEKYLETREALGFPLGRADEAESVAPLPQPKAVSAGDGPLFVEVGVEELPAMEVQRAVDGLAKGLADGLSEARLGHGTPEVFATPRRLAVLVPDVVGRQEDRTVEVAGPPVKAAFRDGKPTKAAEGFARGQGISVDKLVRRETPKGEYLYAVVEQVGKTAAELLPQIIESALANLSFKRSMRWGTGPWTFSRPVVWLVAGHSGEVLNARFAGVSAGGESQGHRFLSPKPFKVLDAPGQYASKLKKKKVIARVSERRKVILEGARRLASEAGGKLLENEALVDEITQLVEWPVPLLGQFDPSFLDIPKEVLISEMVEHQRYLPVLGPDGGLLPCFVVVANTTVKDAELSLSGYRRVLTARFSDGAFFFNEDQKRPLEARVVDLESVRFHRALGTIREKVDRFSGLAFVIAEELAPELGASGDADLVHLKAGPIAWQTQADVPLAGFERFAWQLARSALLAKADLTTQMVFEFPELQGVIGAEYARRGGEAEEVASAIEEHYQPKGAEDDLPQGALGAVIGMADRFDTLVGIFGTGKGPTGAADPFGLRRAALAIIRVLRDRRWHIGLESTLKAAFSPVAGLSKKEEAEVVAEVSLFFRARLKAALTAEAVPTDVAEAALSAGFDDLVDAADRAQALTVLRASPDFEPIAITFKRVANILKGDLVAAPSRTDLQEDVEQALYDACSAVGAKVEVAVANRSFEEAFNTIAELRPAVDAFFEGVMVMSEDKLERASRMGLLSMAHGIFAPLADFTRLS